MPSEQNALVLLPKHLKPWKDAGSVLEIDVSFRRMSAVISISLAAASGLGITMATALTEAPETSFTSVTHVCFDTDAEADAEIAMAEWAVSRSAWAGTEAEAEIEACVAGLTEGCATLADAEPAYDPEELPEEIVTDVCEPGAEGSEACAAPMEQRPEIEADISLDALQRLVDLKESADPELVAAEGFGAKGAPDSSELSRACVRNPCAAPPAREQLQSIMSRPVTDTDWRRYQEAHALHCLAPVVTADVPQQEPASTAYENAAAVVLGGATLGGAASRTAPAGGVATAIDFGNTVWPDLDIDDDDSGPVSIGFGDDGGEGSPDDGPGGESLSVVPAPLSIAGVLTFVAAFGFLGLGRRR